MPKTIQVRNIDDDLYVALRRRAAEEGISVPDLVRLEIEKLASRPSMKEWLERVNRAPRSNITRAEILEALDEIRGPWPDVNS